MAVTATRGRRKKALLPGSLEHGIKQGTHKTIGLALIAAAFMGWLSLISWSFSDPSLNHATDSNISNLLGKPGAIFADILFQTIGLAAIFALLPIAIQGVRMVLKRPVTMIRLRAASWPLSMIFIATTLTMFPRTPSWPLPQNYGGIVGDTMGKIIQLDALTSGSWLITLVTFAILAACSISLFCFTSNLKLRDTAILFQVEDPEQFKATLKAPFNRFGYWIRARQARNIEPGQNQRQWWRNANLDEPIGEPVKNAKPIKNHGPVAPITPENTNPPFGGHLNGDRPTGGPAIFAPNNLNHSENQSGFSAKPHTPADYQNQPSQNLPPMSAKPLYPGAHPQAGLNAHYVDTSNSAPLMNQTARPPAGFKPVKTQKSTLKPAMGRDPNQFILPPVELLNIPAPQQAAIASHDELREMATMLEDVLLDFGVKGSILNVRPGPVVTLFEFEPARGIKTSRIVGLADDIARSMSAISARIAVIPGRNALGIELPNASSEIVFLRDLVESNEFFHTEHTLPLILGRAIGGEAVVTDLSSMPHLLIAGTTGSGKSVGINTMLLSLLYRLSPKECRMIMIDPKMLELSIYDGIPHLLTPVVTDPSKAVSALKWAVREMEDRYRQMSKLGVRNIDNFNERVKEANRTGKPISRTIQTGFDQATGRAIFEEEHLQFEAMPMIVVVIDEMADLMMVAGKDIEATVQRLAQMARAAGIHVIMATQRPSVDVITGTIKANFPTRISFQVTSKIDSRTILGKEGAEQLLGHGDMLFMPGGSRMMRVHGAFVSDDEVERVVEHLRSQGAPEYLDNIILDEEELENDTPIMDGNKGDGLFDEAVQIVIRDQKASISYLQRRLSIGYNKAATLIERMEEEGIIGPSGRGGKREIYGA